MSDETTLLPCWFCGDEAETHETIDGWIATCTSEQNELDGFTHMAQAYGATKAEAITAWNTRATHGTLTAEQVREAVMSADRWDKPMGSTGLTNTHLIIRDDGWQAIAGKLNAAVGNGTCHITASATDGLCSYKPRKHFELSCGHGFTLDGLEAPVACAVCGKEVKR